MTKDLQNIYNDYLATTRRCQDKPFRIRKNFDKFDEDKITLLEILDKMFRSYSSISPEDFFSAPFKVYPDDTNFDLSFFVSQKAKKIYSQYMKQREMESPDTTDSLKRMLDGLSFVYKFCKENKLTFQEYPLQYNHSIPFMLDHLKNHNTNFYVLHALGVSKIKVETRILDFMFADFDITFQKTRNKFATSQKMKKLAKQAMEKLEIKL